MPTLERAPLREEILQDWLSGYPELLPGDQINAENPRRWLLVKAEIFLLKHLGVYLAELLLAAAVLLVTIPSIAVAAPLSAISNPLQGSSSPPPTTDFSVWGVRMGNHCRSRATKKSRNFCARPR